MQDKPTLITASALGDLIGRDPRTLKNELTPVAHLKTAQKDKVVMLYAYDPAEYQTEE